VETEHRAQSRLAEKPMARRRAFAGIRSPAASMLILFALAFGFEVKRGASATEGKATDSLSITLQITPQVKDDTLAFLAEVAEPIRLKTTRSQPAADIGRRFYGAAASRMISLISKFNPQTITRDGTLILEGGESREILLPAGPRWALNVKQTVPRGSTVSHLAFAMMGSGGPKALEAIAALNADLRLDMVPAGEKIRLPFYARVVSYPLRLGYQNQAYLIAARFASDPAITKVEVSRPFRLVPHWTAARLAGGRPECSGSGAENWHTAALFQGVELSKLPLGGKALVAVLDGGLLKDDGRFTNVLWSNISEARGREGQDDDENGYVDDVIGWNFVEPGYPIDDVDAEDLQHHGTHVAGLISGRALSVDAAARLEKHISLIILKVAKRDGGVDTGAVHDAILYAREKGSNIVNLSFEGDYSKQTEESLRTARELLFVIAAGNGRNFQGLDLDLDSEKVYPAKHARDLSNVISVAAHDVTGRLACFSNRGAKTIDLAAPGVEIVSTVDGGMARLSGTSQATPLVTMAASILVALGVREPAEIKHRLMASVDFLPQLQGKVVSEGRLNLAKALAIEDDLLELVDGTLVRGRIQAPLELHGVPGATGPLPLTSVQKVIFNYPDGKRATDRIALVRAKKLQYLDVAPVAPEIAIRLADGKTVTYSRDQLRDLVPALVRPKPKL
jgi:subtilisin family serine protease